MSLGSLLVPSIPYNRQRKPRWVEETGGPLGLEGTGGSGGVAEKAG